MQISQSIILGKFKFLSISNKMLKVSLAKEPCTPNFSRVIKGRNKVIRVGPKFKSIPLPQSEPMMTIDLTHHGDELGLYTGWRSQILKHVANLRYYTE